MLTITIPSREMWDENYEEFISSKETVLTLEHSLLSISKWESKWKKPFIGTNDKSIEETIDYIRCMTLNKKSVDPMVYRCLSNDNIEEITNYISDEMTATKFPKKKDTGVREQITSELIYHWMITWEIPFECEKWHLNRLLTLIRVRSIKTQPPKKMSNAEIIARNAALNEARLKKLNTTG